MLELLYTFLAKRKCKFCRDGWDLRYRANYREWVHENRKGGSISLTMCLAPQWQDKRAKREAK